MFFEVFDSRDLINVLAYAAMSAGKDRVIYIHKSKIVQDQNKAVKYWQTMKKLVKALV